MQRRIFLKSTASAASSLLFLPTVWQCTGTNSLSSDHERITELAIKLLKKWCQGLVAHQTYSPDNPITHGGIYSPGDDAYPGRSADAILPLLWMAKHTNDNKYIEAAKLVYDWEQHNCWSEEL